MRWLAVFLALCSAAARGSSPQVGILNDGPAVGDLQRLYQNAGYSVALLTDLADLQSPNVSLFVIPPRAVFPPSQRKHLSRYLSSGGNLADLSPRAFDYTPNPIDPRPIVDFTKEGGYTIAKPETGNSSIVDKAICLTSEFMAQGDLSVSISLERHRAPERDVICFRAKGDYDIEILALTLEDDSGAKYVAFADLGRGWREFAVPMADFAPIQNDKDASFIDPSRAKTLTIGVTPRLVWKGARGFLAVGPVFLAKSGRYAGVTTSSVSRWRAQYARTKAVFPDWAIDPFLDSPRLAGRVEIKAASGQELVAGNVGQRMPAWEVRNPPAYRGFEEGKAEDVIRLTEARRIPILLARTSDGREVTVADVRTYSDGPHRGGSLILFGIEDGDYSPGKPLGKALLAVSKYVTQTPRILKVKPETTPSEEHPTQLVCRITILNPRSEEIDGRVSVTAGSLKGAQGAATLKPHQLTDVTVELGQVGNSFPMTDFTWQVELEAGGTKDVMADSVNVERSLIQAALFAISLQKQHRDGRFSQYFFTDIYTARMLFALAHCLKDPAVWNRNKDLLVGIKPSDFSQSALRFCDMIASRQRPDGGIPIGYADHSGIIFTADDGTIVLGLLQIASMLGKEDPRAQRYVEVARKYFDFRESFYITPEKSALLQQQFGQGAKGTNAGYYGVGICKSDIFKGDRVQWPALKREERGYGWVGTISMGAVAALHLLDPSDPAYEKVVLRDAAEVIEGNHAITRSSYFHVECLFWMMRAVQDHDAQSQLAGRTDEFIPYLLGSNDMLLYFEGRGALHWLNLAYYRQTFGKSDRTEALMAVAAWTLGSEGSAYSIRGLTEMFPSTTYGPSIGAYRCVTHGSMAFMEMLDPGSTQIAHQGR